MRFIDVSMPLREGMPSYPGDTPFSRTPERRIAEGDELNLSSLSMSAHAGTHVDAQSHFLDGEATIDGLPVDAFSGPALVADLTSVREAITAGDVDGLGVRPGEIALLKTSNSALMQREFDPHYVYLRESAAEILINGEVKAVGIDALSVEGFHVEGFPTHRLLLNAGVGIIEGLDLSAATAGRYWFLCFPVRVVGGDGSPARAVLVEDWPAM